MERAHVLLSQRRYDLAEAELRRALVANPADGFAHATLALCLAELKRYEEATREAEEAIRLAPDSPYSHYALASVLHDRERLAEAEAAIGEAIRLDPEDPDHFSLLANIEYSRRRWRKCLTAAEQGLALDPEHADCTNLRGMALVKLGRQQEAGATIESALAREPENAVTHANQGWALLHRADYPGALVHFREALRLNPELDWAREGLVEALKAEHRLYGLLLRYFLWMSTLSDKVRWGVILGAYFGYRLLREVARANPSLAPLISPVMLLYVGFTVLTWVANPLFNLVLRLNRFGRLVLTHEEVMASNYFAACLLAALVSLAAGVLRQQESLLLGALALALLIIPVSGTFQCRPGWPRQAMAAYSAALALAAVGGIALALALPASGGGMALLVIALIGVFLSTWAGNILVAVGARR